MPIYKNHLDNNITALTVVGVVTYEDVIIACVYLYRHQPPSHVIWEIKRGTLFKLSDEDLKTVVEYVAKVSNRRQGGKIALVSSDDIANGIIRIIDSVTKLNELPFTIGFFRENDFNKALNWLTYPNYTSLSKQKSQKVHDIWLKKQLMPSSL